MKNFEVFRYIRKWKYLVIAICILGAFLVYRYAMSKQLYVAQTVLRYSNSEAKNGMTPSGDTLDVTEIYSSNVITGVLEDLGLNTGADSIRSKCAVEPIIPDDEEQRKAAILKEGEEYVYNPTDYLITFSVGSDYSKEYAASVLDSVLKNYFINYGDKYINQTVLPNNASNVKDGDYDYIECAEILDSSANDIYDYLYNKKYHYPYFRAASTGYSFNDLYSMYKEILSYDVPKLSSKILNQKISKNQDVLIKDYRNRISQYNIDLNNLGEKIDPLYALITQYSTKSKEGIQYHYGKGTDNDRTNDYILKDVYEDEELKVATETTYDALINQYVKLEISRQYKRVDMEHKQDLLDTFNAATPADDAGEAVEEIEADMDELIAKLDEYYNIVETTVNEFNQYLGASNITTLTSVNVTERINIKLYLLIAIILFLICGCLGAVFLGRTQDFVDYLMYIDKKTKLPNRAKCDMLINKYDEAPLSDNFTFILIRLDVLKSVNAQNGREAGDVLLGEFGRMLSESAENYGFVGYNGSDQFMCMFESCNRTKAEMFIANLTSIVEHYNSKKPKYEITFSYAIEESTSKGVYDVRKLMSASFKDINSSPNAKDLSNKNDNDPDDPDDPNTPNTPGGGSPNPENGGGLSKPTAGGTAGFSKAPAPKQYTPVKWNNKSSVKAPSEYKAVVVREKNKDTEAEKEFKSRLRAKTETFKPQIAAEPVNTVKEDADDNHTSADFEINEPPEIHEVQVVVKEKPKPNTACCEESAEDNPYAPKQRVKKTYRSRTSEEPAPNLDSYAPKNRKNRS